MVSTRVWSDEGCVFFAGVPNDPGVRRSLVLWYLRKVCGQGGDGLRLIRASTGRPLVEGGGGVNVSWAHRSGFLLIGTAGRRVGVDLETADRVFSPEEIVAAFFSPEDRRALQSLAPEERLQGFYLLWTLREACLKALGHGLDAPLAAELEFSWVLRARRVPEAVEANASLPRLGRARVLSRLLRAKDRRLRVAKITAI